MLSVGLIEKYPVMAAGLGVSIRDRFDETIIHTQNNMKDFCEAYKDHTFHLIILSFYEDTIDQYHNKIIQGCKKNFPAVPVIIFGEKVAAGDVIKALKTGVQGYVLKGDDLSEIVNCVDNVLKKRYYLNSVVEEEIMNQFVFNKKKEVTKLRGLTTKQLRVANYLSNGMSTSKIAETLHLKASTVSTVKATIFQKLKVRDIIELRSVMKKQKGGD